MNRFIFISIILIHLCDAGFLPNNAPLRDFQGNNVVGGRIKGLSKIVCKQNHHDDSKSQINSIQENEKIIVDQDDRYNDEYKPLAVMSRSSFLAASLVTLTSIASNPQSSAAESSSSSSSSSSLWNHSFSTTISSNPSKQTGKSSETLAETVSGFVSGAALSTTKTLVKYPLDTATVRLQMPSTPYSIYNLPQLFSGSFTGITSPLISNIPGGAVFFAIKDATKSIILEQLGYPKWIATCIAVGVAQPPYWLVRNPSEVIKTRQQAGIQGYVGKDSDGNDISFIQAFQLAMKDDGNDQKIMDNNNNSIPFSSTNGIKSLYSGYWENILYAYPADVLKFLCYEKLSGNKKKKLSPAEAATYGAIATSFAQFVTTPLDVVRNRIMTQQEQQQNRNENFHSSSSDNKDEALLEGVLEGSSSSSSSPSYLQKLIGLAREEGLNGLFAGATPRVGKALLSGAIQFATYEETKESIRKLFRS